MLALKNKGTVNEVFNIGTGVATSINKLAKMIQEIMNKEWLKPIYAGPRDADIWQNCANISKARRILKYKPMISLEDGLTMLVQSYMHACQGEDR